MNIQQPIRLSHLSHGGGCGCKLAPSVLQQLLSSHPTVSPYKQLLVGVETGRDHHVDRAIGGQGRWRRGRARRGRGRGGRRRRSVRAARRGRACRRSVRAAGARAGGGQGRDGERCDERGEEGAGVAHGWDGTEAGSGRGIGRPDARSIRWPMPLRPGRCCHPVRGSEVGRRPRPHGSRERADAARRRRVPKVLDGPVTPTHVP